MTNRIMKSAEQVILISPGKIEVTRSSSEVMWGWIKNVVKSSMASWTIEIPEHDEKITISEFMENYAPEEES